MIESWMKIESHGTDNGFSTDSTRDPSSSFIPESSAQLDGCDPVGCKILGDVFRF